MYFLDKNTCKSFSLIVKQLFIFNRKKSFILFIFIVYSTNLVRFLKS